MNRSAIATEKFAKLTGRIVALAASVAVTGLFIMGCGNHTTYTPSQSSTDGTKTATYVGEAVCKSCHDTGNPDGTGIYTEFTSGNPHGQDFTHSSSGDLINGHSGSCLPCHTVAFQAQGGFQSVSTTPQLIGIGCEDCHGPGSLHVAHPSKTNINPVPDAKTTCWNCHVGSYKQMGTNPGATTDASLHNTNPGSVAAHHPQTLMLNGVTGYVRNNEPGPHAFIDNTCVACHAKTTEVNGHIPHDVNFFHGNSTTCASCHDDASTLKTQFQAEITQKLIELGGEDPANPGTPDANCGGGLLAAYAAAHNISLTSNSNPDDPAVKAYKGARYDYSLVLADGSTGVHNPTYAENLLQDAKALVSSAQ